jgi:hypothetical protein
MGRHGRRQRNHRRRGVALLDGADPYFKYNGPL